MKDLHSKIFYKIQFDMECHSGGIDVDLLWELVMHIKRWLENKRRISTDINIQSWTRFKTGNVLSDTHKEHNDFYAESYLRINPSDSNDISWACMIRECQTQKGYAPRWWTTEIGYQSISKTSARVTFVVSYSDAMGFIGKTLDEPDISVPNIVKNIQADDRFDCSLFGKDPIQLMALPVSVGEGMALNELIMDQGRMVPIILIMPKVDYVNSEQIILPINPNDLANSVAGNALVYYSEDISFVDEMKYVMDTNYRCVPGAIRLYLPHINPKDPVDSSRHRFIQYHEIMNMGSETVLKIFRRVLAQDVNDYDKLFRVDDCKELKRKDKISQKFYALKNEQQVTVAAQNDSIEELNEKLKKMECDKYEVEFEKQEIEKELNEKRKQIYNLSSQVQSMTASLNTLAQNKEVYESVRQISEYPKSVEAVVRFFAAVFPDKISMTERCWKSLDECRTEPSILWNALYSMVDILYDELGQRNFSDACREYQKKAPFDCVAGNSSATKKDNSIMQQYIDYYQGKEILIEAHVKKGGNPSDSKFVRIYFTYIKDDIYPVIVIGSIGKHLDTAGTRYQK